MDALLDYLRINGISQLETEFHISAKRHNKYPNLICLKYDQIETPVNNITIRCRGSIVDEKTWKYVSFPYQRFFNYGEGHAADIDWSSAKVLEKYDGTLITVYYYKNEWHAATSKYPDASSKVDPYDFSFNELFWSAWKIPEYSLPQDTNYCYMFELITPYNRIIVQHLEPRIVLHGVRNMTTLEEEDPIKFAIDNRWEHVLVYPISSLKEVIAAAENINPISNEGFVVCDSKFQRVKIKAPSYVRLHLLKSQMSPIVMLDVVRRGESPELLAYFPEMQELYEDIQNRFNKIKSLIEEFYDTHKSEVFQKDFALKVKDSHFSSYCFLLRKGLSLEQILADCNIKHLAALLSL